MTVAALVFNEFIDDLREKIAMGDHVPTPELIEVKRCTSPVDWADINNETQKAFSANAYPAGIDWGN